MVDDPYKNDYDGGAERRMYEQLVAQDQVRELIGKLLCIGGLVIGGLYVLAVIVGMINGKIPL